jgi:Flp pilus assembly pilin Flp
MLSSAKLGHALQQMPTILDLVRKFRDFLKDESAAATIEYIALSAGIAVAVLTAVKPAKLSPACQTCGRHMRFVRAISKFRRHPELRIYECDQCRETVVEEWRPRENAGRQLPNSREGARTLAAGLMVLRKEWGMRNFDIAVILATWAGSIAFGWKQQPYWLVVPLVVCVAYVISLIGRHSTWAVKVLGIGRRKVFEMWMSVRAASLALFKLLGTWRWAGVGIRYRKKQDEFRRRDLALETVCPEAPLLFSADQMNSLLIHWG